jgi:hypothetical protein
LAEIAGGFARSVSRRGRVLRLSSVEAPHMRHLFFAATLALVPTVTNAQMVEVGATLAAGCLGNDGSFCGSGTHAMPAAHASWWFADQVEVGVRVARATLPPFRHTLSAPDPVRFEVTGRSREFVSALFVYHFRRGSAGRPFAGFGSGGFARAQRAHCEPIGCRGLLGLPPEGRQRTWMPDVILAAGASGDLPGRWVVRGGVLCHRFANDENSTIELLIGIGYRFGRR